LCFADPAGTDGNSVDEEQTDGKMDGWMVDENMQNGKSTGSP
jgi:hypothetical protein